MEKKVFIADRIDGNTEDVFLITSLLKQNSKNTKSLFSPEYSFKYSINIVKELKDSDCILLPTPIYKRNSLELDYIQKWAKIDLNKKVCVFIGGDLSHDYFIDIPNVIVLKTTQYKFLMRDNEIIIPPICDDIGSLNKINFRSKSDMPIIGFCGWAGFSSRIQYFKYLIKNILNSIKSIILFNSNIRVFKKGLYFRRLAVSVLNASNKVKTNFIIRKSFSGNARTISISPEQARNEYINNIINSDFVLAPKGDANYSVRFFEALSLGRIPILIDTDVCLPMEDKIDYSKCILRISYKDINKLPDIVADFYGSISDEEFIKMQKSAREVFEKYLRYDSFFNSLFK